MPERYSFPKEKIKVLLLEGIHDTAVNSFKQAGYVSVERLPHALNGEELEKAIRNVHILGVRSASHVTEDILNNAKHLLAVGCFCIGTNQVDLKTAERNGIPVFNAPFSNTRSVAELVIAHIVYLMRGIGEKNAMAHRGVWLKSAKGSNEVRSKTLGIVGYGRIGTQVSVLAESMGMKVIYYDPAQKLPLGNASPVETLDKLLESSDVVTLHVPDLPTTRWLIGEKELGRMRKGAKLINLARGKVVDIDALTKALESGHIGGAALDVFPEEPGSNQDPFKSKLLKFDNVILTPHIGGSTIEAQENIGLEVADKLITYSDNGSTTLAVNFPEVDLPPQKGKHRLLHIHKNQTGVLSGLNEALSSMQMNIAGQYLQTDPEIGYVVIDVDQDYKKLSLEQIEQVPGTIKVRVLY